jgi:hypothetical protein
MRSIVKWRDDRMTPRINAERKLYMGYEILRRKKK